MKNHEPGSLRDIIGQGYQISGERKSGGDQLFCVMTSHDSGAKWGFAVSRQVGCGHNYLLPKTKVNSPMFALAPPLTLDYPSKRRCLPAAASPIHRYWWTATSPYWKYSLSIEIWITMMFLTSFFFLLFLGKGYNHSIWPQESKKKGFLIFRDLNFNGSCYCSLSKICFICSTLLSHILGVGT